MKDLETCQQPADNHFFFISKGWFSLAQKHKYRRTRRLKIPTGRKPTSWLFTSVAEKLNSRLRRNNSCLRPERDLNPGPPGFQVRRPYPLDHAASHSRLSKVRHKHKHKKNGLLTLMLMPQVFSLALVAFVLMLMS